jgi:hypothetical protein
VVGSDDTDLVLFPEEVFVSVGQPETQGSVGGADRQASPSPRRGRGQQRRSRGPRSSQVAPVVRAWLCIGLDLTASMGQNRLLVWFTRLR